MAFGMLNDTSLHRGISLENKELKLSKCLRYLLLCLFVASNARAESLIEIYELAIKNNHQLKAAEFAFLAEKEGESIAKSHLLPTLDAELGITRSETDTDKISSNPFSLKNESILLSDNTGYTVSLTQPVIDWAAFQNVKRSSLTTLLAALQFERIKNEIIIDTVAAYLQVLRNDAKLSAAQSAEDAYALQLKAARLRVNVGLARESDVLEAQARYESVMAEKVIAKNNLSVSFDFLGVLTGKNHSQLLSLPDGFNPNLPEPLEYQYWAESAKDNNIDINISKLKVEEARYISKSATSEHMPKLSGRLNYSDYEDDREYTNAIPDSFHQQGVSASLILSVPLYSGGRVSASARQANYRYLESKDMNNNVFREVVQTTHSTYLGLIASVSVLNSRKAAINSSQSAFTFAKKGYEEGIRSMLDVLAAQNVVYKSNQDYSDALYEHLIAGLMLKDIAGTLSLADIEKLNSQLDVSKNIYYPSLK